MKQEAKGPTPTVSGREALERMKDLTRRILKVPKTAKAKKATKRQA